MSITKSKKKKGLVYGQATEEKTGYKARSIETITNAINDKFYGSK